MRAIASGLIEAAGGATVPPQGQSTTDFGTFVEVDTGGVTATTLDLPWKSTRFRLRKGARRVGHD